jgi:hypothetical protein
MALRLNSALGCVGLCCGGVSGGVPQRYLVAFFVDLPRAKTVSDSRKSWLWLWLAVSLFVGVMVREAYNFATYDNRVPVEFHRVEVLNSPIQPGGYLELRVWREKVRSDCPVVSAPFVTDRNGVSYALPSSFSVGGPVGTEYLDVSYLTPLDLPAGSYMLRDVLSYRCPGEAFDILQPVALFVVAAHS